MIPVTAAETRKLVSMRWFWTTIGAGLAFTPVTAVTSVFTAGKHGAAPLGTAQSAHHILSSTALTSMLALGIGIAMTAGEYRHGTAVTTFLATPRRYRVMLAKIAVAAVIGAALGAIGFGLALAAAVPALSTRGVHHLAGDTTQMWYGATAASALFGIIGVAVGALTRSTAVAIVTCAVWAQFIEAGFLAPTVPALGKWLPTAANISITHTATHPARLLTPGAGAAILVAYTAALSAAAMRSVRRRDV